MRIIAGSLRGRLLGAVPDGVRPTADRVRESLFSALGPLEHLRVLDLCAGTGALGLEAHSRGAGAIVWVERSRAVARALAARLVDLGLEQGPGLRLVVMDALRALGELARAGEPPFDLVFFDPPYASEDRMAILEALFASPLVDSGTTVVVEGARRHPLPAVAGTRVVDERRYGDTVLIWLARAKPDGGD